MVPKNLLDLKCMGTNTHLAVAANTAQPLFLVLKSHLRGRGNAWARWIALCLPRKHFQGLLLKCPEKKVTAVASGTAP